jgi:drug/metabolite transporter (DMT)-like permease
MPAQITPTTPTINAQPTPATIAVVLLVGVLAVSFAAVFVRLSGQAALSQGGSFNPYFGLLIAAGRMAIAGVLTLLLGWPALLAARRAGVAATSWLWAALAGIMLAAHLGLWIMSLQFTSVAASTAIVTTNPVWLSLFSWLVLRERPKVQVFAGIAISVAGGVLIGLASGGAGGGSHALLGNLLALGGAWTVSAYYLFGRAAQRQLDVRAYTAVAYPVAGLVLAPWPFVLGLPVFGYPAIAYFWIALLALVPQLVGHTAFNWAVKFLNPAIVTMVILLEPVGSAIGAAVLFGEIPGPLTLAGALALLAGVAVAIWPSRRYAPSKVESRKPAGE